jgi:oxygen-independent coproporphyrinogen III oxidase
MHWNSPAPTDQQPFDPAEVFAAGLAQHHIANTAYPIGHISTMRPYRVPRSQVQSATPLLWQGEERLGLYVHIPFCERRCGFCEYTVVDPATRVDSESTYFDLLQREFELYDRALDTRSKTLIGFDIGGGTPAIASLAHIEGVLEAAHRHFRLPESVTISIETTPKIAALEPKKLAAYHHLGIRRISMGVQTINPHLLALVGRTATSVQFNQQAAENVRAAGFERFNVDIMYGFARQTLTSVEATLRHVIELGPEYITLYRTRYKGTSLASQAQEVSLDEVNQQATLIKTILHAAGYHGTPGKNTFSRLPNEPGTSDYLTERVIHGTPYLGLGLGAQSLSQYSLAYNSGAADKRLGHYQKQVQASELPIQDLYHLSREAAMGKMISVSFYFGEVNLDSFARKFGVELAEAFPAEVDFVLRQGYMEVVTGKNYGTPNRCLRLTQAGELVYNGVIALFYAGAVKEYLLGLSTPISSAPSPQPRCATLSPLPMEEESLLVER